MSRGYRLPLLGLTVFVFLGLLIGIATIAHEATVASAVSDGPASSIESPNADQYEFQAEVSRLMDILINSLYQNRDIFLRELISNASDALDKLRFIALTDERLKNDETPLEVRVSVDRAAGTLTIADRGVGMTKNDLISNLGTIARSGTSKFLQALSTDKNAVGLIGQFGVGFYSAFLVADTVTVTSKHANDTQYVWQSDAKSSFKVFPDPAGETLGLHGTQITMHLKEDAVEFLEDKKLEEVLKHYSEFIEFPILLEQTKKVNEELPLDEDDEPDETKVKKDDEELDVEDVEAAAEKPKTKTVTKTVQEWVQMNANKPIWTRPKSEIDETEYVKFFKALSKDDEAVPVTHTHFKAEGGVDFSALLYIPEKAAMDFYEKYYSRAAEVKLFVRRVLVQSEVNDLLPRYLNFVKGVVDSNDLPISVSRETIQENNKVLKVIGKKLARRVLKMLEDLSQSSKDKPTEASDMPSDDENVKDKKKLNYETFWEQFGRSIRLGLLEDKKNQKKLLELLRYKSLMNPKKFISLAEYVEAMPETQKYIYYITGSSQAEVENSPMLEQLKKRNFDVLFFTDNIDEYTTSVLDKYDDKEVISVTKEGMKFGDDADDESRQKALDKAYSKTMNWIVSTLTKDRVVKVTVSNRVATSPAILVSPKWAWDANMIRIMQAQALSDFEKQRYMAGNRVLEVNPAHPIIKEIKRRVDNGGDDDELKELIFFVYDAALLNSGYTHSDPQGLVNRLNSLVAKALKVEGQPIEDPVIEPISDGDDEDPDDDVIEGDSVADGINLGIDKDEL